MRYSCFNPQFIHWAARDTLQSICAWNWTPIEMAAIKYWNWVDCERQKSHKDLCCASYFLIFEMSITSIAFGEWEHRGSHSFRIKFQIDRYTSSKAIIINFRLKYYSYVKSRLKGKVCRVLLLQIFSTVFFCFFVSRHYQHPWKRMSLTRFICVRDCVCVLVVYVFMYLVGNLLKFLALRCQPSSDLNKPIRSSGINNDGWQWMSTCDRNKQ